MSLTIYLDDCSDHNRLIQSLTQAGTHGYLTAGSGH